MSGNAAGAQVPRLRTRARGLSNRLWYGGGSQGSAAWTGRTGFNLLTGNIVSAEDTDDFATAQTGPIERFRREWPHERSPRVALGRVILPTDGASAAKRRRYTDFARSRHERALTPQGARHTLFRPDIVGTADEILEALRSDPVLRLVSELRLELPYEFEADDYAQIVSDFARTFARFHQAGAVPAQAAALEGRIA